MDMLDAVVERIADLVAERVLAKLRGEPGLGTSRIATSRNNPTGSSRAFKRGARAKAFPTIKYGRQVAADWVAVETWWREECTKAPEAPEDDRAKFCRPPVRRGASKAAA